MKGSKGLSAMVIYVQQNSTLAAPGTKGKLVMMHK